MDYSSLDWKWAVRLANRGYDAERIAGLIRRKPRGNRAPYSVKFMRILETRGLDRADAYARTTAEKAVAWVKEHPPIRDPSAGRAALAEIRGAANSLDWTTYGGPGPRRTLEGLFVVADRLGSVSFSLANRAWAELVGMTVPALLRRRATLFELGWLRRNPRDRYGRTARYVLQTPDKIEWYASTDSRRNPSAEGIALADVSAGPTPWRSRGGLGTAADSPYQRSIQSHYPCGLNGTGYLAHDAFRPDALGDCGWLAVARDLPEFALSDLLDRIATEYGTAGALERDKERHRRERERFRSGADA